MVQAAFSVLALACLQLFSLTDLFRHESILPAATLPEEYLVKLRGRHVIFVDGLLNEAAHLVGNYFCDNISEIKDLGISHSHIGYLSSYSVPKNADTLVGDIHETYVRVKLPIILVGHSKGGAECLYAILKNPHLLQSGIIDRVVLINPAVGGSPLADNVSKNILARCFSKYLGAGLRSIQPENSRKIFSEALEFFKQFLITKSEKSLTSSSTTSSSTSASSTSSVKRNTGNDSFKNLSDRVFYIRGAAAADDLCWGVRFVIFFCRQPLDASVPNDGLLHVEDQMLHGFGIDLGILDSDHIDLVVGE
jgi:pimeloyl-ACP methyl ester carboxylesterase